jgi:hypothetical protein
MNEVWIIEHESDSFEGNEVSPAEIKLLKALFPSDIYSIGFLQNKG